MRDPLGKGPGNLTELTRQPSLKLQGIEFRNNLGKEVELKGCADDDCGSFDCTDTVEPGELYPENVSD